MAILNFVVIFLYYEGFKPADIKAVAKKLGVTASDNFIEEYTDRTRQKHRLLILELCGYIDFDSAIETFEEAVTDMVDKQMHPRKLFYVLVEQLRQKKIELPSYDRIARAITDKFHAFEKNVVQKIVGIISPEQQEALNQLVITQGESYERALLLERITSASILTWQHVNLHGTYDFSNLLSSNDPDYTLDEVINFKAA